MLEDAEFYSGHQRMQSRDAGVFLESVVRKMDWSRQEQDVVMDIGCGPGKSTREIFLSTFPRVRKLIGMDVSENMIEFAKENNAHEKIEYIVADIQARHTVLKWSKQISKVVSSFCFHWLASQKDGFRNIYCMLKPGGEAALVFVLSTPLWDSYELHYNNPKWSKYLQIKPFHVAESHIKRHDAAFYRDLLQDIGFDVIICEEENLMFTFLSEDDCRNTLSLFTLSSCIPDDLRSEFKEDILRGFIKFGGRGSDGEFTLHYKVLNVLVRKPDVRK